MSRVTADQGRVRTYSRPRETERFCEERAVELVECEAMETASAMAKREDRARYAGPGNGQG